MTCCSALALILVFAVGFAHAGEFNPKLSIGDAAHAWKHLPGVDEKQHSLADLKDAKLVLVVFTCNSCDVAVSYEDRIIAFTKKHKGDVAVVAVNVSTKPADALPFMKERAKEKKISYLYLFDKSQKIGKAYGANFTPEFFLLDADRKIAYMGALDDNGDADKVTHNYVEQAVAATLKGAEPTTTETAPRGCRIRYPRTRRPEKTLKNESVLIGGEQEARDRVRRNPPPTLSE
ncbi:MAG: thioredoxin family protein [Pirellulales bacterium]|nr:thioredoxin family protein [Pirellulales bacterium]